MQKKYPRHNKGSAALAKLLEGSLNLLLCISVHSARGFVKKDNVWALENCPGNGNPLEFASGKFANLSVDVPYFS